MLFLIILIFNTTLGAMVLSYLDRKYYKNELLNWFRSAPMGILFQIPILNLWFVFYIITLKTRRNKC